jgi:hypothetical protein
MTMSSAEHTAERETRTLHVSGLPWLVGLRRVLLLVLAGWTVFWAWSAVGLVRTYSKIGAGTYGATIDGHEIFEFVFVASHCLVRWAPVAIALVVLWAWTGRRAGMRSRRQARA